MLVRSCTAVASANALTILDHLEACNSRNHVPQVKKFGVCSSSSGIDCLSALFMRHLGLRNKIE